MHIKNANPGTPRRRGAWLACLLLPALALTTVWLPAQEGEPVPRPAAGSVEDSVHEELTAAHERVEALVESGAPQAARAAAYGNLGQLYAAYGLWNAARGAFSNARTLESGVFQWAYLLGYVEAERSELEAAVTSFSAAVEIDPAAVPARLRLGEALLDLDRASEARRSFAAALEIDAESAAAHFGLARALDRGGETEEAVRHYESALRLQPTASQVRYPLALAYRKLGRTDEARRQLAERGEAPVGFPDRWLDEVRRQAGGGAFHKFRGDQAVLAGNLEEAAEAFEKAVEADPDNFYYRKSLGLTLYQLKRTEEARNQLVAAIDLDPGEVQAKSEKADLHYTIGSMAANEGVLEPALQHYAVALDYDPEHVDTLRMVGNIRGRQGRLEDALTYFTQALEADPDRSDIRLQRATTLMDLGRFDEAIPELRRLLDARTGETRPGAAQIRQLLQIATERAAAAKTGEEGGS